MVNADSQLKSHPILWVVLLYTVSSHVVADEASFTMENSLTSITCQNQDQTPSLSIGLLYTKQTQYFILKYYSNNNRHKSIAVQAQSKQPIQISNQEFWPIYIVNRNPVINSSSFTTLFSSKPGSINNNYKSRSNLLINSI